MRHSCPLGSRSRATAGNGHGGTRMAALNLTKRRLVEATVCAGTGKRSAARHWSLTAPAAGRHSRFASRSSPPSFRGRCQHCRNLSDESLRAAANDRYEFDFVVAGNAATFDVGMGIAHDATLYVFPGLSYLGHSRVAAHGNLVLLALFLDWLPVASANAARGARAMVAPTQDSVEAHPWLSTHTQGATCGGRGGSAHHQPADQPTSADANKAQRDTADGGSYGLEDSSKSAGLIVIPTRVANLEFFRPSAVEVRFLQLSLERCGVSNAQVLANARYVKMQYDAFLRSGDSYYTYPQGVLDAYADQGSSCFSKSLLALSAPLALQFAHSKRTIHNRSQLQTVCKIRIIQSHHMAQLCRSDSFDLRQSLCECV